eukprot:TRINITY_DN37010_c0_g1_i1.p1 TRINITY_DN37010_c0_g1~~TRINITY_DN37010_c0_g1_i1.p1  ORF type:complete len:365 (-),score=28.40 TRINITY_DN37010_c0_g1_i1:426-1406(-)
MAGRPPPAPCAYVGDYQGLQNDGQPNSPLAHLVQHGYNPGGMCRAPGQPQGFDAGVAQQWSSNVKQTTAAHQQRNDPNYVEKKTKTHGYRVSHAPGGGSSVSLSWDEPATNAADPARRGRGGAPDHATSGVGGCFGEQPPVGRADGRPPYRSPSTDAFGAGVAGVRASSREPGGSSIGGCFAGGSHPSSRGSARAPSPHRGGRAPSPGGRAPSPYRGGVAMSMANAAYESRAPASYGAVSYGGGSMPGNGVGNYGMPPLPQPSGAVYGAAARQADATSLAFGNRVENGSSNAFACGANQNCGNGITDRRTTRVAAPPGGRSQICFG